MPDSTAAPSHRHSTARLWLDNPGAAADRPLTCNIRLKGLRFHAVLLATSTTSVQPTQADARRHARALLEQRPTSSGTTSCSTAHSSKAQAGHVTSIPWTKDLWTKVRAPRDSALVARTAAQSHSELLHMCVYCLCHGRIPCRSAQHWCDSPPCLASTGPSPLTPATGMPATAPAPRLAGCFPFACRSPGSPT